MGLMGEISEDWNIEIRKNQGIYTFCICYSFFIEYILQDSIEDEEISIDFKTKMVEFGFKKEDHQAINK